MDQAACISLTDRCSCIRLKDARSASSTPERPLQLLVSGTMLFILAHHIRCMERRFPSPDSAGRGTPRAGSINEAHHETAREPDIQQQRLPGRRVGNPPERIGKLWLADLPIDRLRTILRAATDGRDGPRAGLPQQDVTAARRPRAGRHGSSKGGLVADSSAGATRIASSATHHDASKVPRARPGQAASLQVGQRLRFHDGECLVQAAPRESKPSSVSIRLPGSSGQPEGHLAALRHQRDQPQIERQGLVVSRHAEERSAREVRAPALPATPE